MIEIGSIWIDKPELHSTFIEGADPETCLLVVDHYPYAVMVISNLGIIQDGVLNDFIIKYYEKV